MLRSGCHFVNNLGTLLHYSLSITEQMASSIANRRTAFKIKNATSLIGKPDSLLAFLALTST